jgi:myo-inositol-1(or 4)-monophosphatase
MDELDAYLAVCQDAVKAAGATVQSWIGKTSVRHKGPADLVTEADFASQEVVRATVLEAFPDHTLLGEEDLPQTPAAASREAVPAAPPRWITDPLDGTTNYVHGVPHYCVSLALEHRGVVLVGAVYDPALGECFSAARGRGAFLNGRPLRTSPVADLSEALAATGFPAHVKHDDPDLLVFNEAIYTCQGVRRTGSAALNMCYLAAGRFDVLWAFSTKVWDVAAGSLLIEEAGGTITAPRGGPFVLDSAQYIAAANTALYGAVREMVRRAVG